MAETQLDQQVQMDQQSDESLKYLDFVQVAAIYAMACFSSVYEYAKDNSGPLKPGVQTVEGTVKAVISPVYDKFHDVPFELLKFADQKVENSLDELDRRVPFLVKQASSRVRAVASQVQRAGVVDTAMDLYGKYEPVVESYAVSAWRALNMIPLFPQAAQIAVPTAAYWLEAYNRMVCCAAERGYPVAGHLPLIPVERIAKVFNENGNGPSDVKQ